VDPRNSAGKLVLTILAGVATRKREILLERQSKDTAKVRGQRRAKYQGRTPTGAWQTDEIRAMHANGLGAAAMTMKLARATTSTLPVAKPTIASSIWSRCKPTSGPT
jgi:DNA invertase Pin-like site-specific DNA recombinase